MKKIELNLATVQSREELHKLLAKTFSFPEFYGNNFDAFWDCINDPDLSVMLEELHIYGISQLEQTLQGEKPKLISCLLEYQEENPEWKFFIY
ncbi:barstar family protein [Leptospira haakeii]|uniref:Barstar (barnase inhibitor) domain-containing protein n=1 Tax=Leptospira haakeii TaxID=2023198 RepID=A0ABX4PEZ4_9LEPT|nr:barstar family protein [Leptospira haakeii]PKA14331.1 hypothetical protein CH363_19220 [Leptospira haakeii]PKA18189.1 hypothetical protein CH377_18975 [Leptospira haakeii]